MCCAEDSTGCRLAASLFDRVLLSRQIGLQVRMQAAGRLPDGHPRKYTSSITAYRTIISTEGVAALWTGLGPNIARNAIINAAELASYDQIKESLLK